MPKNGKAKRITRRPASPYDALGTEKASIRVTLHRKDPEGNIIPREHRFTHKQLLEGMIESDLDLARQIRQRGLEPTPNRKQLPAA